MRIVKNKLPFPHVIIHDFYTDTELCDIWREIDFLSYPNKLHPPEETNSAVDDNEIPLKNNLCLLYTSPSPRDLSTSRMPSSA